MDKGELKKAFMAGAEWQLNYMRKNNLTTSDDFCFDEEEDSDAVKKVHEVRLELMAEAKEKGMSYDDYVGRDWDKSEEAEPMLSTGSEESK